MKMNIFKKYRISIEEGCIRCAPFIDGMYWKCFEWKLPFIGTTYIGYQIRLSNGDYVAPSTEMNGDNYLDERKVWSRKYVYRLKTGEVQTRTDEFYEQLEIYSRKWLPFWKKKIRSIEVLFDENVGEGARSMDGGVISCRWDLLKGESAPTGLISKGV